MRDRHHDRLLWTGRTHRPFVVRAPEHHDADQDQEEGQENDQENGRAPVAPVPPRRAGLDDVAHGG